ncbi:hypothetical protein BJ878DRAFT_417939 [Calycina marina]|uniref:DUF1917-domain-containing protein n=1 Tax=Calycina marina TaxID=1763456 RepID=A0A9P8CG95_9HELO|nr:hypothetical protein BJ878DRAFT_417939 [Calycina marina]
MAVGKEEKRRSSVVNNGYLSDDSSFYGDSPTKRQLNDRAASFSPTHHFTTTTMSPTALTILHSSIAPAPEVTLHNPYAGVQCARQHDEAIDEFLARLPAAMTRQSDSAPWIYIVNPFQPAQSVRESEEETQRWADFVRRGIELLNDLRTFKVQLEGVWGKVRLYAEERERVVKQLQGVAVECKCTSGKWMLFVDPAEVNFVWSEVARYTAKGELGHAAKVAPDGGDARPRLICVYTEDYTDIADVTGVAKKMKDIGLIGRGQTIYYKCGKCLLITRLKILSLNRSGADED